MGTMKYHVSTGALPSADNSVATAAVAETTKDDSRERGRSLLLLYDISCRPLKGPGNSERGGGGWVASVAFHSNIQELAGVTE